MATALLQNVDHFSLQRVRERYASEHPDVPEDRVGLLERELKRFLALSAASAGETLPMASTEVDDLWHTLILFTEQYASFCSTLAGCNRQQHAFVHYLHHEPNFGQEIQPDEVRAQYCRFRESYKAAFGEEAPADVWPVLLDDTKCTSTGGCSVKTTKCNSTGGCSVKTTKCNSTGGCSVRTTKCNSTGGCSVRTVRCASGQFTLPSTASGSDCTQEDEKNE